MNLQDRIDPTVSEQCCSLCVRSDYTGSNDTMCANSNCPCHSPSSGVEEEHEHDFQPLAPTGKVMCISCGVEPTAPVGGWEERIRQDTEREMWKWADQYFPREHSDKFAKLIEIVDDAVDKHLIVKNAETIKNREREIAEGVAKLRCTEKTAHAYGGIDENHGLLALTYDEKTLVNAVLDSVDALINKQ